MDGVRIDLISRYSVTWDIDVDVMVGGFCISMIEMIDSQVANHIHAYASIN